MEYDHTAYARSSTYLPCTDKQADQYTTGEEAAAKKASRSFKKYSYRGVELDQLLDLSNEKFIDVSRLAGIVRATLIYSSPPTSHATPLYPTMLHALSTTARSRPSPKKVPARIEAKAHGSHQEAPTRQEERRS
jgi:hypothetical protein